MGTALRQRQRWLLIALLACCTWRWSPAPRRSALLCWLVNVGLFILWQPFIYAERTVDFSGLAVIALLLACGAPGTAGGC
jgi:tryptophan-rich sensory protein